MVATGGHPCPWVVIDHTSLASMLLHINFYIHVYTLFESTLTFPIQEVLQFICQYIATAHHHLGSFLKGYNQPDEGA